MADEQNSFREFVAAVQSQCFNTLLAAYRLSGRPIVSEVVRDDWTRIYSSAIGNRRMIGKKELRSVFAGTMRRCAELVGEEIESGT